MGSRTARPPSPHRWIVLWGTLLAAIAVLGAVMFFESQLAVTLDAVTRSAAAHRALAGGGDDPFATCPPEEPSSRIGRFLAGLEPSEPGPPAARSALAGINLAYGKQLLFTLAVVLPVAVVLAAFAFVLAFLVEQAERRGWRGLSGRVVEILDAVPYILWTIPAIFLALVLLRSRPFGGRLPYPLYLALIFLGFGTFLLVFYLRQNRHRIIAQRVVLDGERMSGIGEVRLFWRLFRFHFAPTTFPRQALYAAVFIMLLDFTFFTILPTHQPGKPSTVFAEGNYYHELTLHAHADAACGRPVCYLQTLERLERSGAGDAQLTAAAQAILSHPGRALDLERRQDLCHRLQAASETATAADRTFLGELAQSLELPGIEQEAIFFQQLAHFYIRLNCCVAFAFFFIVFIVFDARVFSDA